MKNIISIVLLFLICALTGCASNWMDRRIADRDYAEYGKPQAVQYAEDTVITSQIKLKYLLDWRIRSYNLSVTTEDGIVELTGMVPNAFIKQRAMDIAMNTPMVRGVNPGYLFIQ